MVRTQQRLPCRGCLGGPCDNKWDLFSLRQIENNTRKKSFSTNQNLQFSDLYSMHRCTSMSFKMCCETLIYGLVIWCSMHVLSFKSSVTHFIGWNHQRYLPNSDICMRTSFLNKLEFRLTLIVIAIYVYLPKVMTHCQEDLSFFYSQSHFFTNVVKWPVKRAPLYKWKEK